eukprot:TRINITY_DN2489_c0_g1_i5.p1 TRINITY_DN2489_c0_g1~~TRINITY_DN2489_c0_g1_i5.p1  ORF type:complete len:242 (+),score=55.22 TRINITY_DN2489_c0_g1_i5:150-875(+)
MISKISTLWSCDECYQSSSLPSKVSLENLEELGVRLPINRYGGLAVILGKLYPHYDWNFEYLNQVSRQSGLRWLLSVIKQLFPQIVVVEAYTPLTLTSLPATTISATTATPSRAKAVSSCVDVFLPVLNLGFDYQGHEIHYTCFFGASMSRLPRDTRKQEMFEHPSVGITLVEVPYWWNGDSHQLAASVRVRRPDLLSEYAHLTHVDAIPKDPPVAATLEKELLQQTSIHRPDEGQGERST